MQNKIMLVGEAYGEKEEEAGRPFVGASGWLLNQTLSHAGIVREDCYVTNVFNLRPRPSNDIKNLCCGAKESRIPGLPELDRGKYVRAEFTGEVERLYEEICKVSPNLVVALGATAAWALLHSRGIKTIRGAIAPTAPAVTKRLGRVFKVLPTYHPAMVLRDWSARPILIADFDKAKREAEFPEVRRPKREVWTAPTLLDLATYEQQYILGADRLALDIETKGDKITCVGFSPSPSTAIVIPFFSDTPPFANYWPNAREEVEAWEFVRRWMAMKPLVFQNGLFDMGQLWKCIGLPVGHDPEDTMLLHHAWMPELQKGLGFLATLYTDEASWKFMGKGLKHDAL